MNTQYILTIAVLLVGCGEDAPEPCWFDLSVASVSKDVFVVRDCGTDDHGLYRIGDTGEGERLNGERLSRVTTDAAGAHVFVSDARNRRIIEIDPADGSFVKESAEFGNVLGELRLMPAGDAIWSTVWLGSRTGAILVDTTDLGWHLRVPVGGQPVTLAVGGTPTIVAASPSIPGEAKIFDPVRHTSSTTFETVGALDTIIMPPDRLALLEDVEERVVIRELSSGSLVFSFSTSGSPRRLAVSEDGRALVVTERDAGQLRVIDPTNGDERLLAADGGPEAVAIVDGSAYVGLVDARAVVRIDLASGEETGRFE